MSITSVFAQKTPDKVSSLLAWFCADSIKQNNGTSIGKWETANDKSIFVEQTAVESQPLLISKILNDHSVVRFDGINDFLDGGDILDIGSHGKTFFIVGKSNKSKGGFISKSLYGSKSNRYSIYYDPVWSKGLVFLYQEEYNASIDVALPFGEFYLLTAIVDKNLLLNSFFVNEKLIGTIPISNSDVNSPYNFLIGAYNNASGSVPPVAGYFLNGDIAEIIIYDKPLTKIEMSEVEGYLRNKYAPKPVSLGADITITNTLCDTVLHAGAGYASYLWSTGETTEAITVSKSGYYSVDVTDAVFGFQSSDAVKVTFNVEPHIIPDTVICPGNSLLWDTKLNTTDFSYKWSTGETTSSIIISGQGKYAVTVSDKFGCSYKSDNVNVAIDTFDTAIDLGNDTTLCKYNEISLKKGDKATVQYLWGDGSVNKTLPILTSGKYYLTATDLYACKAKDSIQITISGIAPNTQFSIDGHCEGTPVVFTDNSVSQDASKIVDWYWYVESDTVNGKSMSHTFNQKGNYYITEVVKTDGNCIGQKTKLLNVYPKPVLSFAPFNVCQFKNTVLVNKSTISSGTILTRKWEFADMTYTNTDSIPYTFTTSGDKDFILWAQSDMGCRDTIKSHIEVKSTPDARFVTGPSCKDLPLLFYDETEVPASNGIVDRKWYINNKLISNAEVFSVTDILNLPKDVLLYVKGINGCSDTVSKHIIYGKYPQADFSYKNSCAGDVTPFTDASIVDSSTIEKWKWTFDDNAQQFTKDAQIAFADTGLHTISLIVITNHGCTDTVEHQTHVIAKPHAVFDYNPKIIGAPVEISFTNSSEYASEYKWKFGDTEESDETSPVHMYADSGTYKITLYAMNDLHCVDSAFASLQLPKAVYKLNLVELLSSEQKGFVKVGAVIVNSGLNPITSIDYVLTKDDGTFVKETWKGFVNIGEVDTFYFASQFKELNEKMPKYICVDVFLKDLSDSVVATYNKCLTDKSDFYAYNGFPNPADTKMTIHFSLPKSGNVVYSLYRHDSKLITQKTIAALEGFNSLDINTTELNQGMYYWTLRFADSSVSKPFVVQHKGQ